ncbi:YuzD family protein [Caldalkalibacillus mannanilyticus]|uniref:YuzD family protein n=1 Tax=Caldalkalibacillus mannanilyticus TaxID=1418 RepID=UPI000469F545|nr:DUF1462 family protein [Caldalkalibacillus mannanilyticus]
MMKNIDVYVYGAEQICASCVGAPSSKDTAEWLDSALNRKYENLSFHIKYVDIYQPQNEKEKELAQRVIDEEFFYPLIVIQDEIAAEGIINIKQVYSFLEEKGIVSPS